VRLLGRAGLFRKQSRLKLQTLLFGHRILATIYRGELAACAKEPGVVMASNPSSEVAPKPSKVTLRSAKTQLALMPSTGSLMRFARGFLTIDAGTPYFFRSMAYTFFWLSTPLVRTRMLCTVPSNICSAKPRAWMLESRRGSSEWLKWTGTVLARPSALISPGVGDSMQVASRLADQDLLLNDPSLLVGHGSNVGRCPNVKPNA